MNRRGFTLVELIVALVLMGIVSGAIYQLLVTNQRVYQQQNQRVDLNSNIRAAVAILPTELRELNAGDAIESDIMAMSADSIVYKAPRALYTICLDPPPAPGSTGSITIQTDPWFGTRRLDVGRDAIMIYAEGDPTTVVGNRWIHLRPSGGVTLGTACPGMKPSATFAVQDVKPIGYLDSVAVGAPVRAFEVMKVKTYQDSYGDHWVGSQRFSQNAGWGALEPVLGPIAANGLRFAYFDTTGTVTAVPGRVARIQITVIGKTRAPVRSAAGRVEYVLDTLVTEVALRNNPR